jgi:hypothetical protein
MYADLSRKPQEGADAGTSAAQPFGSAGKADGFLGTARRATAGRYPRLRTIMKYASPIEMLSAVSVLSARIPDFEGVGGFVDTARKFQARC